MNEMPCQIPEAEKNNGEPAQVHHMRCVTVQIGDEQNKVTGLRGNERFIVDVREDVHCAAQGGEEQSHDAPVASRCWDAV